MPNWRDLGEVPDSEEECDLDGQEDYGPPSQNTPLVSGIELQQPDIWEIHDSQPDELPFIRNRSKTTALTPPTVVSSTSSPLSSAPSHSEEYFPSPSLYNFANLAARSAASEQENVCQQTLERFPSSQVGTKHDHDEAGILAIKKYDEKGIPTREHGKGAAVYEARQTSVRFERSLRPRKPIQEHPYLLENALYSKILKKHGVKPLGRLVEAASREQAFAPLDDDFEETSQGSAKLNEPDSSKPRSRAINQPPEDNKDFELLLLSPPATSPLNERGRNSSRASSRDETDITSTLDQDLPALDELLNLPQMKVARRQAAITPLMSRKRMRLDVVNSDTVEPGQRFSRERSPAELGISPGQPHNHASNSIPNHPSSTISPPPLLRLPHDAEVVSVSSDEGGEGLFQETGLVDFSAEDGERGQEPETMESWEEPSSQRDTESDSNLMTTLSHQIRGVLPASWLRLDQQSIRDKARRSVIKSRRRRSPDREGRRGIAQVKQKVPGSIATTLLFDESSKDNTVPPHPKDRTVRSCSQVRLAPDLATGRNDSEHILSDDGYSVTEDTHIDFMLPKRRKRMRQLKLTSLIQEKEKPSQAVKNSTTLRQSKKQLQLRNPAQCHRKIFGSNLNNGSARTRSAGRTGSRTRLVNPSRIQKRTRKRICTPPPVSILDIIETDAPRFLKIAARTAKQRQDKGRSGPGRKSIQLATRQDNIGVMSVLREWRAGSIPQRPSVTGAGIYSSRLAESQSIAEGPRDASEHEICTELPATSTFKLAKRFSDGGIVTFQQRGASDKRQPEPRPSKANGLTRHLTSIRPAQLEKGEDEQISNAQFHVRKRLLDCLYRTQRRRMTSGVTTADLEPFEMPDSNADASSEAVVKPPIRNRCLRKRSRPSRVDLEAPQYSRVNDPLPMRYSPDPEPLRTDHGECKLQGLGPYGTNYTHHFEIFPLDSGVYFQESTLMGGGVVSSCLSLCFHEKMAGVRPYTFLSLDGQALKWGPFDLHVSSELGIALDSIAEKMEVGAVAEFSSLDSSSSVVIAGYILTYFKDSVSFTGYEQIKSFVARTTECLDTFNKRMELQVSQIIQDSGPRKYLMLKVYDRLLLASFVVLTIVRSEPRLITEQGEIEGTLKRMALTSLSILFSLGAGYVRKFYEKLNDSRQKEFAVTSNAPAIESWVVIMQILGTASIPKACFWDLAQTVITPPQVISSNDARAHEMAWEMTFALLPLTEFDHNGLIRSDRRQNAASEGWIVPQKLLKQVFHLYARNCHQSPSFNSYCRALVSRCHYLVQYWGWRRCSTVVRVIFDFFGSQNLAHLRNEEVFESPNFLEKLDSSPSLELETKDKCFHVFLKLLALSTKKLREAGSLSDVRNVIARVIPNHSRQHLKDQNVHARDLAALRNHHDLLSTLYWVSPPELRPLVSLIEGLVPASSHKEACLISIRCWSQLARFVVASGEASNSLRPLTQWRNRFFQQILQQLDSVASDVEQEMMTLSKDTIRTISEDAIQRIILINRAVILDVLYACMAASLDVMRHTPNLEAATFAINTCQLQSVFKRFSAAEPQLDWRILSTSLRTLDAFLDRIDEFKETEESQQSESQILISAQADDALMIIDQDISQEYFSMARRVVSCRRRGSVSATWDSSLVPYSEQVIRLSARMGTRFMNAGILQLSDLFKAGKYGLFAGLRKLELHVRQSLVLFIATLLKYDVDDMAKMDVSLLEVWMLSLVKPREYLAYEIELARELRRHGKSFVPATVDGLEIHPNYDTNRDLFEFAISAMRKSIRDVGPSLQKTLLAEHSRTLRLVMEQMKSDLGVMSDEVSGHSIYVEFVRDVMALIKTHGTDICGVDSFFLQISKEYSPSIQDPKLQLAGLHSYGMRLMEGDGRVSRPLFFLLFNNVKSAMVNDRLKGEVNMLRKGMKNPGITGFVIGSMLPAVVRACFKNQVAFPVLDVYAETLRLVLADKTVARELDDANLAQINALLQATVEGLVGIAQSNASLSGPQLHLIRQTMALVNLVWPSLYTMSTLCKAMSACESMSQTLGQLWEFTSAAQTYLDQQLLAGEDMVLARRLCAGVKDVVTWRVRPSADVDYFTQKIAQELDKDWVMTATAICVQTPANHGRGAVSALGIELPRWDMRAMMEDLSERVCEWRWWWRRLHGVPGRVESLEALVF